ncbi:hypothetical protein [Aliiroseovarius halocynthiae]|nr:hypothetical protein [Aliiroseovarius halocynthiae]
MSDQTGEVPADGVAQNFAGSAPNGLGVALSSMSCVVVAPEGPVMTAAP